MNKAIDEAKKAYKLNEVPIGAILIDNTSNKIISSQHNQINNLNNATKHAEMMIIEESCLKLKSKLLLDTTMFVTLEPCAMCAGAIVQARISRLVYAVEDKKTGACGSVFNIVQTEELNHSVEITKGILERECQTLIKNFFKEKRLKKL